LIAAWVFELTAMMKLTAKGRPGSLSDTEKSVITATCQRLIDEVLKPSFLLTIKPTQFNNPRPQSDIGQSEAVAASRIKQQHLLYCPAAILTRSQTA
jgi:hypothetical protein